MKKINNGFTIVEHLVSLLLLSIAIVGGMAYYTFADSHMQASFHRNIATELANSKMEELRKNGYSALPNTTGLWQGPSPILIKYLSGNQSIYVFDIDDNSDGATDYKQVKVEIAWQEPSKTFLQNLTLDTYITP